MDKNQLKQLFIAFEAIVDEKIHAQIKYDGSAISAAQAGAYHQQSRTEKEMCYKAFGL